MNWFKETWWLVKQLFTTTKNKDKVQYKHWIIILLVDTLQ